MQYNDRLVNYNISSRIAGVYGWMSCALTITAGAAYYVAVTPEIMHFFFANPIMMFGLFIFQVALVLSVVSFLPQMRFATALALLFLYAVCTGILISSIFFVFDVGSIISTFLTTAITFALMSFYGFITKSDLTALGTMSIMVLIGLVVAMVINVFLQNSRFEYVLSVIGVLIFVALIAYDTQKIKEIFRSVDSEDMYKKVTIVGALTLYLDFINLFLFLLRFMGKKRE